MSRSKKTKSGPLLSKINKPRLAACYPRQRLFYQLDKARQQSVIWVSGPPGSGKTSLVSSYIEARELNVLWYQIDARDTDLATFFYYIGLAVKQIAPRQYKPLPALTIEYIAGLETFTRNFFEELYSRLKAPFVLVLDNYQELPVNSPFHQMLNDALAVLPEAGNAFIISRSEPVADFARLRVNQSMVLLEWQDLQLTIEEACGIARLNFTDNAREVDCTSLLEKSHGWVAGLILLLNQSSLNDEQLVIGNINSHQAVFDYFSGEILNKSSLSDQKFLLQSAFLPQMTVENTRLLTGQFHAKQILDDLVQKNYFIVRLQQPKWVYQYHPLFQEFLLATAEQTFSAEQLDKIRNHAAELLIENHNFAEAAELLQAGKNWPVLIELIMQRAQKLISHGRNKALQAWISSIPPEYRETNPWLCYWLGMCCLVFDPAEARKQFIKSFDLFEASKDQTGLALSWAAITESVFIAWDDFVLMDPWLNRFEETFGSNPQFDNIEIEVQVVSSVLIAFLFRRPELRLLSPWVKRAEQLINHISDCYLCLLLSHKLLFYYSWMGDPAAMRYIMDILKRKINLQEVQPLYLIYWYVFENIYDYIVGDSEHWHKTIECILKISDSSGVHVLDDLAFAQSIFCSLGEKDISEATMYLEKLEKITNFNVHMAQGQYLYLSSLVSLQQRDLNRAMVDARNGLMETVKSGVPYAQTLTGAAYCHVLFESGRYDEAIEHLNIARHATHEMHSAIIEYQLLSIESYFAFETNDNKNGLLQLQKAMAVGRETGLMNFPGWRADVMAKLCVRALKNNIEVAYVQSLIRTHHFIPQKPSLHLDNWPWPVKIYTLGRFSLLVDNEQCSVTGKSSHRPLEFLKALITFGGRKVSQEKIIEALWPDANGDSAMKSLYTTLHRLRKLLKHEEALSIKDGQITLHGHYVWVDVWSLERLLGELDQLLKHRDADSLIVEALSNKLEECYRGSFLESEPDRPWLMPCQEKLRARSLRVMLALGTYWSSGERWQKALVAYEKGLELDPLAETFYQHLMQDYFVQGRLAEALATYKRCRKVLSVALNIMPSEETLSIYQRIKS